jgi:hypothetical protein
MSALLTLAGQVHQHKRTLKTSTKLDTDHYRNLYMRALKELFETKPPVNTVIYELLTLLLVLPVYDRIYVQRALRPLAQKLDCIPYLTDLSRALQEVDAWVDLNILTDHERRSLPDMGLEISPEFKLP